MGLHDTWWGKDQFVLFKTYLILGTWCVYYLHSIYLFLSSFWILYFSDDQWSKLLQKSVYTWLKRNASHTLSYMLKFLGNHYVRNNKCIHMLYLYMAAWCAVLFIISRHTENYVINNGVQKFSVKFDLCSIICYA